MSATGTWTVELGDVESPMESEQIGQKEGVFPHLLQLVREHPAGRICVDEDVGERTWFARKILGMNPRIQQMHFALEWCGEACSLIFFDEAASEYRAKDPTQPITAADETRLKIAHGELAPHPIEECLSLERGLNTIQDYLKSGERPSWLKYKYVG